MKRLYIYSILLFLLPLVAYPCINPSHVRLSGEITEGSDARIPYGHSFDRKLYKEELQQLEKQWNKKHDINDYLDYGVLHVYLGEYEKARAIFTEIEQNDPGKYATAANLGTTYELLGDNRQALKWISEAVRRNPKSHYASEWIHVNILKAKLEGEKAFTSQFLIQTSFGKKDIPATQLSREQLVKLRNALYYQLNERISFVKAPDPLVGLLLFEYGNVVALTDDVTTALSIYNQARKYGYDSPVFRTRYARFKEMNKIIEEHPNMEMTEMVARNTWVRYRGIIWGAGIGLVVLSIAALVFFKQKKRRSAV